MSSDLELIPRPFPYAEEVSAVPGWGLEMEQLTADKVVWGPHPVSPASAAPFVLSSHGKCHWDPVARSRTQADGPRHKQTGTSCVFGKNTGALVLCGEASFQRAWSRSPLKPLREKGSGSSWKLRLSPLAGAWADAVELHLQGNGNVAVALSSLPSVRVCPRAWSQLLKSSVCRRAS